MIRKKIKYLKEQQDIAYFIIKITYDNGYI